MPTSYLPYVGVLPIKHIRGAENLTDAVPELLVKPFTQAFEFQYESDAHFVTYKAVYEGLDQPSWPRCNLALLPRIRAAGGNLMATMLVLDYDNPGHKPWTPESWSAWLDQVAELSTVWSYAAAWTLLYNTRNGARLVYNLAEPIPVDDAEPRHKWLVREWIKRGIPFDTGCSDWTRVFRLPYVVRDELRTWHDEVSQVETQINNYIDANVLGSYEDVRKVSDFGPVTLIDDPKPSPDTDKYLRTYNAESGRFVMSAWIKEAQKRMKGRESYDCLFGVAPLAEKGSRDTTVQKYVGQAIGLLYYLPGTTPAHIYALFFSAVNALEPDSATTDWTDVLWRAVCNYWAREAAKARAGEARTAEDTAEAENMLDTMLHGMREWCGHPELHGDDEKALDWMFRRLIANVGANYRVMMGNGYYDSMEVGVHQLIARIKILGMDRVIEVEAVNKDGQRVEKSAISVVSTYVTVVSSSHAKPELKGAIIDDMDLSFSTVIAPSFSRNRNLKPTYNTDVDTWLRMLFGKHYDNGCEWIAWALAFDEGPICALSLAGRSGVGKKLLVQGLAECLSKPALADANDIVSNNQYGLLESPFLVVNEGWPRLTTGRHPADQFRAFVAGDPIRINRKFLAPCTSNNPVRVIFTANNLSVVQMLTAGRDMSPEDREALAIRLYHIGVDDEASTWLRLRGGMRFTGAEGRRWIAGDGNQPSDYVVAKHFLWLYSQRDTAPGTRFLMDGNGDESVLFEMRTQSGTAPVAIEAILRMVEAGQDRDGLCVRDGEIFILISQVLDFFRSSMQNETREKVTAHSISNVMRSITIKEEHEAYILKGKEKTGRRRWHRLDLDMLLAVAVRDGWKAYKLEKIIADRDRLRKAAAGA